MYRAFPKLENEGYKITSLPTYNYNCIAWAVGENHRAWWPDKNLQLYWPEDIPREATMEAFTQMFAEFGYTPCDTSDLEEGFEKVAIYLKENSVTHASRQLPSGEWTSKLGPQHDISHTLTGLDGPAYGNVSQILKREIVE